MDARAAGISRRRAAIGGLWRPQLTPTDSIRPYSTLPNRYSTTTIFPTTTQPLSNPDNHREPQPIHNRPSPACRTRTCKALLQPSNNHAPTILRVESKNDSDSTIPHSRSSNSDSTMHTQKTARQICTPVATALRLAYGSGDMRLFQRPPGNIRFAAPHRFYPCRTCRSCRKRRPTRR